LNLEPHYKVLGLAPGCTLALIKKAYLREIRTWHPDRYTPDSILRERAEERTKDLTAAYAALSAALKGSGSEAKPPAAHEVPSREASKAGDSKASAPEPETRNGGEEWLGRIWRRLKDQWRGGPAAAGQRATARPAAASQFRGKGKTGQRAPRRSVSPPFDEVLQATRSHPQPEAPADTTVSWRRLAARRSRYHRRRTGAGATAIGAVRPRGPVDPVDPVRRIRPIGEDG